jgi:DNA invertase Pin-like site-specific DNA recombinase
VRLERRLSDDASTVSVVDPRGIAEHRMAAATSIPTSPAVTALDVTRQLAELVGARTAAAAAVDDEVRSLRARGVSWPIIATALSVSRQAARQRYARLEGMQGTELLSERSPDVHAGSHVAATDAMTVAVTDAVTARADTSMHFPVPKPAKEGIRHDE